MPVEVAPFREDHREALRFYAGHGGSVESHGTTEAADHAILRHEGRDHGGR